MWSYWIRTRKISTRWSQLIESQLVEWTNSSKGRNLTKPNLIKPNLSDALIRQRVKRSEIRNFTKLAVFSGCLSVCDVHIWMGLSNFKLYLLPEFWC